MDEALGLAVEMNQWARRALEQAVADITDDEIDWRLVPPANSVNVIVRHLRIESEWHLNSLMHGESMPSTNLSPAFQARIDAVPLDFRRNLTELRDYLARFVEALRAMTLPHLAEHTLQAYGTNAISNVKETPNPTHLLGYHQALHIASHAGQIRATRNLLDDAWRFTTLFSGQPNVPPRTGLIRSMARRPAFTAIMTCATAC